MLIKSSNDIERIMSDEIEKFINGETKGDRLNTISKAMMAYMKPTELKIKVASLNKDKASPKFLDND
jgi:hypothetical protein